ncbi:MAG: hypothetical protein H0V17_36250, partial [Deltaproteobacteria bacterium]|nr:hypothetical protein [Deltaproteobacteria bacterium]
RPARLAAALAATHGFALAIDGGDVAGAIAPASKGTIHLHHIGRSLDTREHLGWKHGVCALAVDSDAIVPSVDWKAAGDTARVHERDYGDWEILLVRAALRALIGDRPLELHGPEVKPTSSLAAWAFAALARDDTPPILDPILDAKLLADLKAAPIIHALGEHDLISIKTLVSRFPLQLFYVEMSSAPVEGFAPMVCGADTATAIGKLAGVPIANGDAELELRRRTVMRDRRLVAHRSQPERAFGYPVVGEIHVPIPRGSTNLSMRGLVGVGRGRLEIDVRIENRTFQTLTRTAGLPLYAVVDLDLSHADDQLTGLSELVAAQLIEGVSRAAARLLVEIAKTAPEQLGDLGPTRTLLRAWLDQERANIAPGVRAALCEAPAFVTVQGGRTSIAEAAHPNNIVRTARWPNEWLPVGDDEPASALDTSVIELATDEGELDEVVRRLHDRSISDVSGEVAKLQAQRRMARGLIPVPSLPHVPSELKRKLSALGPIGKKLGHGEIGLVSGTSSALIHDHGVLRQRLTLDVAPAIHLAIEAPDLLDDAAAPARELDLAGGVADQLARLRDLGERGAKPGSATLAKDAQELAVGLLAAIFATPGRDSLPIEIKQSIRLALVTRRVPRRAVKIPVFELVDGSWVDIDVIDRQIAKYGNAWAVTSPTRAVPLDDDRQVFLLTPAELSAASGTYAVIDATSELALDDKARRNRAKPLATSLDLRGRDYLLAEAPLDGDGVTKPRGVVGALLPHAVEQRGVYAHKEMRPFELMTDPCRWPTIAIVDDARLEPDRAWERPLTGTASWRELTS